MKKNSFTIFIFILSNLNYLNAQIGKSIVLNGCTDYFEVNDHNLLDLNENLSIECWISPNCNDGNRIIVGKEWCLNEFGYYLSVNEGRLFWAFSKTGLCEPPSNTYQTVEKVIYSDVFTHVAVVHTQTEIHFYINGKEVMGEYFNGSFSSINNSSEPLRIGAYKKIDQTMSNFYSGLIDELRVWNVALTESQVLDRINTTLVGNENGLVLYLAMEENGYGPDLILKNKSLLGDELNAFPVGVSANSPYTISNENYKTRPFNLGDNIVTCKGTLDLGVNLIDYKNLIWSTGETSAFITISNSGTYSVQVETELCKFFNDTVEVILSSVLNEEIIIVACEGESIEYDGNIISPNSTISLTYQNNEGCDSIVTISLNNLISDKDFLGENLVVCDNTVTLKSPYSNTIWNNGIVSSNLTIQTSGKYSATYIDSIGCINSDSINVEFIENSIYIPNVFSPNLDGINDCFKPLTNIESNIGNYSIVVFDRWGNRVFESSNFSECWNGEYRGKAMNPAVYTWIIERFNSECNKNEYITGAVTLIR